MPDPEQNPEAMCHIDKHSADRRESCDDEVSNEAFTYSNIGI